MKSKLAIEGGEPVKKTPNPPMIPGAWEIGAEEKELVMEVLNNKMLFRYNGPPWFQSKVAQFEKEFAAKTSVRHALAVNSCTSAMVASLVACEIGPGCEVIVPAYTFFATCAAVIAAKAIPVITEVDESLTLDPQDFERKITPRTRAVMPVHMRGVGCKMDQIMDIAKKHKLKVIEDVAQACGGTYHGRYLGAFGDCGCFSFGFHKTITCGEGGAILTDNDLIYDRAMMYHDTAACWRPDRFGLPRYDGEVFSGMNFRMGEINGAIMLAQLGKLDTIIGRMRKNKARIKDALQGINGITFREIPDEAGDTGLSLIFFLPEAQITVRFVEALKAEGVEAAGIYDSGIPDWHIYKHWKHVMDQVTPSPEGCPYTCSFYQGPKIKYTTDMCPKTLSLLSRAVHLDIPPRMTDEDCDLIAEAIRKVAEIYL